MRFSLFFRAGGLQLTLEWESESFYWRPSTGYFRDHKYIIAQAGWLGAWGRFQLRK